MLRRDGKQRASPKLYHSDRYTNRLIHEVLPDNSWAGKPCFIIGGGPSLKDFDWSRLKGKRTIGVNLAFMKFEPTVIFSMDTRFLRWIETGAYGHETKIRLLKATGYKLWNVTYKASLPDYIFIAKVFRNYNEGRRAFTSTLKEGLGHGANSGYGALNLACCLGANPIYLLGFDCKHENGKTHWHDGHPSRQTARDIKKFALAFEWVAPQIKRKGIRVINLNPDSGLNCFEKRNLEGTL